MKTPAVRKLEFPDVFNIRDAENELIEKLSEAEKFPTEEGTEHDVFFASLIAELNERL